MGKRGRPHKSADSFPSVFSLCELKWEKPGQDVGGHRERENL